MGYIAQWELALDFVSFLGKKKDSCTYGVSFGASADYSRSLEKKRKVIKLRKKIKIKLRKKIYIKQEETRFKHWNVVLSH